MIRAVTIGALLCLLVLVLYLPSASPPERFLDQIRTEHQAMEKLWGKATALRILNRALSLQDSVREVTPVPSAASAPETGGVTDAVTLEMASVSRRLFDNNYFRAIDALVLLAAFRLSAMVEWLPWVGVFAAAAVCDGLIARQIKAREFRRHDPEQFALFAGLAILCICTAAACTVAPVTLQPLAMPIVLAAVALLAARSVAQFHRRG